ncbi:MAG TPA: ATP-binding cassette domain-containing protein [Anaerolineae bacterium]|nr:ATP-binding cassette domain-containing protein [Anaerolineae bacterium]
MDVPLPSPFPLPSSTSPFHSPPSLFPLRPAIEVRHLWYWYENHIPALQDVSLTIEQGEYVAIIGQNGSGKTTLVKHFNGLLKPRQGKVFVEGEDAEKRSVGELARRVGYVFQNPDHQIFCTTTREEIAFGLRNLGFSEGEVRERTEEALRLFGLAEHAEVPPAILGYGLRRKVTLAAVYAMRPPILVLDEPTTGLDWRSTRELLGRVAQLHQEGHTIVLVSHDMKLVAEFSQKTLVLGQGRVLLHDATREVFKQEELLTRTFIAPPPITALSRRMRPYGMRGDSLTVGEFYDEYTQIRERRGELRRELEL